MKKAADTNCASSAWADAYDRYLQSPAWLEKRRRVMERARGICEGCGERRAVEVHHRAYPRCDCLPGEPAWIRAEKLFDLAAVCERCHQDLHPGKIIRKYLVDKSGHHANVGS